MDSHCELLARTVLRTAIESLSILALIGVLGVSLPLALAINGILPLWVALVWSVVTIVGGVSIWSRYMNRFKGSYLPPGEREAWFFTVSVFFGMIGVGIALVSLSTFGAQTISSSHCIQPSNVNVTSTNCKMIETIQQAPSGGIYSDWGPRGAFLVILGAVGLPSFLALAALYYIQYGRNPKKS
jgi:hypothetical protein